MKKMKLKSFGVMIDVSRNNVMSMDGWRRFLPILAKMGYDTVFLYAEDTYEVEGEPYFGYMRGRYSIEEMKELDDLAYSFGIEMIPCIQTLAHLNTIFKWRKEFPMDAIGTLMVGDERTYELIDNMFSTLSKCFRTKKLHVGMDEAYMLGRGKYLDKNGYESTASIMKKHLERVVEIGDKYGYKLLMWSDMFFNDWTENKYNTGRAEIPEEYVKAVPESVIPVYWNYYSSDVKSYDDMFYNHRQLTKELWFAGGAWTWTGFIPDNGYSLQTMLPAFEACRQNKVENIFITLWGDNGGECSKLSVLPTLFYLSELARGNSDEEKIKAKFKRAFGIGYDEYMYIDLPNKLFPCHTPQKHAYTPAKYMTFSDYFNGFPDYTVGEGGGKYYEETAAKLASVAKSSRKFGYIFDSAAKLSSLLAVKYELGVKTRAAYKAKDFAELTRLANEDYTEVIKRLRAFYRAFLKQWMAENKSIGFEVQEARLGAMLLRTESCKKRLLDLVAGKISRIEELEAEILPFEAEEPGKSIYYNGFIQTYTANVM